MFLFFISNSILELTTIVGPYGHTTGIDFGWQHPFIKGGGQRIFLWSPTFCLAHDEPQAAS